MGEIHSLPEMIARKMAVDLRATAAAVTHEIEVSPADGISFTKDHEQAQRKGVKTLAETTVERRPSTKMSHLCCGFLGATPISWSYPCVELDAAKRRKCCYQLHRHRRHHHTHEQEHKIQH